VAPARLKEWAYAGFAIDLVSALIAHLSVWRRPAPDRAVSTVFSGLARLQR
jgi:hypothetical protein